jgi:GPI mannosyltransferase 3
MRPLTPRMSLVGSRAAAVFWLLTVAGIGLRLVSAVATGGFVHPDEHQQYLEVAHGIVYGYHVRFWEYVRGIRHYLYPYCLAALLHVLDKLGIHDPVSQAAAIRALLGVAVFASIVLLAHDWMREGRRPASLCLLSLAALSPDMIHTSVRTLSETAATVPLALSMHFLGRKPFWVGLLLGVMFALRFQTAFLVLGFLLLALYDDRSSGRWLDGATARTAAGLTISLLLAGLIDRLTWGSWFHSPVESLRANVIEGIAARFGVEPWYEYLDWAVPRLAEAAPLFVLLFFPGMLRERRLTFLALIFIAGHSAIAHKEFRFVWPIAPIVLLIFAAGFEVAYAWLAGRSQRVAFVALFAGAVAWGSWRRFEHIDWNPEPSRTSSAALARLGRYADLSGVAVFDVPVAACGNYFYLRRNVPLVLAEARDPDLLEDDAHWAQGRVNYLLTWPENAALFERWHPEEIERVGGLSIYKVRRPLEEGLN